MQFLTALFGGSAGTLLNAVFALGIVLVLIVIAMWLMKLAGRAGESVSRGRQRRLVVVDSALVDGKRKVLLIRRDNVEHVIMTGGPQDLVIETGIPVPEAAEARRPAAAADRQPPAAPAQPAAAADIARPATPERPVTRDTVDRLNDLARPAPLRPRPALRHTALLRPVAPEHTGVIPMSPERRMDNSNGRPADSARSGAGDEAGGQAGLGGRNRFFRDIVRDRS